MTLVRSWLAVAVLALSFGSVRPAGGAEDEKKPSWLPDSRRALFVCVVEDQVTLSWKTEPGSVYTIMYTDKPSGEAKWAPLPGYIQMPGTGKTETAKFKVDPARPRRFNLRVEDASKVKPAKK